MPPKFPVGITPLKEAHEYKGGVKYYARKQSLTAKYHKHTYYLILWRDTPRAVSTLGDSMQYAFPYLKYITSNIRFYRNPEDLKSDKIEKYGLYVRMEK